MRADKLDIHLGSLGAPRLITTASGQAGQADFGQHLDEACRAATPVTAASVSALPDPFHPEPGESFPPLSWRHDSQQTADELIGALPRNGLPDTGELRPIKRPRILSNLQHAGTERPPSEIGDSGARVLMQPPTHQVGISEREARRVMLGDEHEYTSAPHPGGGGPMLWAVQPDRPISVPEGQHHPFHPIDAAAIKGLRSAKSADKYSLFAFSRWLVANGRPALAPRLRDPSLEEDLKEYASTDSSSHVAGALCNLKKSIAGISLEHWLKTLLPPSDDAKLIEKYRAVSIHAGLRPKTVALFAGALTRFSKFLHQTDKKGIADRIDDRSLDCDVESYKTLVPEREAKNINQALVHLRRLASGGEIAPPEYAVARRVGDVREAAAAARPRQLDSPATARLQDAYRYVAVVDVTTPSLLLVDRGPQPASSQELPSTPPRLSGEDWDMLWELRQEPPLWPQPGLGLGPQSSSFHAFAPMPSQSAEDGSRYGEQIREPAPYPLMKLGRHRNLNG